ncbi:hypothetical protein EV175_005984 [Coemansia sp. RSA 1933]|nr:hypothetical protein EV175_005984 [Coemansia sp. RSA 1933]
MLTCSRIPRLTSSTDQIPTLQWSANTTRVARAHALRALPTLLISEEWRQDNTTVIEQDKRDRRASRIRFISGPSSKKHRIQLQFLEKIEAVYTHWKERSDLQVEREDASAIPARRRRQIMKQPRLPQLSADTRTAAVPPIARP